MNEREKHRGAREQRSNDPWGRGIEAIHLAPSEMQHEGARKGRGQHHSPSTRSRHRDERKVEYKRVAKQRGGGFSMESAEQQRRCKSADERKARQEPRVGSHRE